MLKKIERVGFDIIAMVCVLLFALFAPEALMPELAKAGLVNLWISKLIFVSSGVLHAHISRKLLFPYISFLEEKDWSNNLMVIMWYVTIIFCWARGG